MLKRMHEILQITLETLGILLIAAGAGVAAAWRYGWPGFLVSCGVVVMAAAYVAERRLHPPAKKAKPPKPAKPPRAPRVIERVWWRFGLLGPRPPVESRSVHRAVGRLAWLRTRREGDPE